MFVSCEALTPSELLRSKNPSSEKSSLVMDISVSTGPEGRRKFSKERGEVVPSMEKSSAVLDVKLAGSLASS